MTTLHRTLIAAALLAGLVATSRPAAARDPVADDFRQSCSSCHTIGGGRLTGPDLKGVGERRDPEWLIRFVLDPGAVIDAGDPTALELLATHNNVRMPAVAGMTRARAEALLALVARESQLDKSQFQGLAMSTRPFTPADVARGRELFLGTASLANGGGSCMSCHACGQLPLAGGGRLGPDLTKVFERYADRKTLGAWLSAPATPTMAPTFRDRPLEVETEVLPLVAFFEHASRTAQEEQGRTPLTLFFLLSAACTGALLALGGRVWGRRFRAVRRPLVRAASWSGRGRGPAPSERSSS
ncbi:MAG: c-type cytochrome [Planctomycetes bacterium]|nr:c-type cytochrome [Planctomycetota bacterium]MCB9825071.1 c-type cytochrome [Planctomycetota bacterium]MCB9830053.1 c-type cytochrome [Planctomycetota bacterium]MCB9902065.1 c-type cytochrome [Planctomycetota bacterium]